MTEVMYFPAGYEGAPLARMAMNFVAPSPSRTSQFNHVCHELDECQLQCDEVFLL